MRCKKAVEEYQKVWRRIKRYVKRDKHIPVKLLSELREKYNKWEKCMKNNFQGLTIEF